MSKPKPDRNERLYKFWLAHQAWGYRSIGKLFRVSHTRVGQVVRKYREQETSRIKPDAL